MPSFETSRHDPLLILGFLLLGLSGWQSFVIYRRLAGIGYRWQKYREVWPLIGTMPLVYLHLNARKQKGWRAWPAYLVWIFAVTGIAALVTGLFRLRG